MYINTMSVWKVSNHFEYIKNQLCGLDANWQQTVKCEILQWLRDKILHVPCVLWQNIKSPQLVSPATIWIWLLLAFAAYQSHKQYRKALYLTKKRTRIHSIPHISKVGDHSRGWPEGSLFNSYYTNVLGREQLLSLDCSTLPLIRTLDCWVLSKEASSTIFYVFGMTRPRIERRSSGPFANSLTIMPMSG